MTAPWWTPPPGLADVAGWLAAMREVEAVLPDADGDAPPERMPVPFCGCQFGAVSRGPDGTHTHCGSANCPNTAGCPVCGARRPRGGVIRGSPTPTHPPPRAPQPLIETGRLRASLGPEYAGAREVGSLARPKARPLGTVPRRS